MANHRHMMGGKPLLEIRLWQWRGKAAPALDIGRNHSGVFLFQADTFCQRKNFPLWN
jgi:hypothetical protein